MRKWRVLCLAFVCFVLASFAMIGSASWLIVRQERQAVVYFEETVNPYFESEATFTGGSFNVALNDAGKEVYGENATFTAEWIGGAYVDETEMPNDARVKGKAAGKHYYKIIDDQTGQTVSDYHTVTIAQDTLSWGKLTVSQSSYFVGGTVSYNASLRSSEGITFALNGSSTIAASDYTVGATMTQTGTLSVSASSVSVEGDALDRYLFQNNYVLPSDTSGTFTVLPTCYVTVNGGAKSYYADLDSALTATEETNSANTVVVAMQSFTAEDNKTYAAAGAFGNTDYTNANGVVEAVSYDGYYTHTISTGKTVASNVTLSIPYDSTGSTLDRNGSGLAYTSGDSTAYRLNPVCVNKVTLSGKLTNNGTITVGGVLGREGQGIMGSTSQNYSMLAMAAGAILNSTGNLNVYGYITNTAGGATVNATSGTVTMPFVVHDYYGGSHTAGSYKAGGVSPFSIFDMPNIHAELNLTGGSNGAKLVGYADLHTGAVLIIPAQHNLTTITLFGASGALINMTDGKATFQYTSSHGGDFGTTVAKSTADLASRTKITLNGTTSTGSLSMTVKVATMSETVALTDVQFPISYKFDLNLVGNHSYNFLSMFKFMPGSKLTIGAGANVTVAKDAGLLFYEGFASTSEKLAGYNAIYPLYTHYKTDYDVAAQCNIAGNLTVNGYFAGYANAIGSSARLDLSNATALTASEAHGLGDADIGLGVSYSFDKKFTETQEAKANVKTSAAAFAFNSLDKRTYRMATVNGTSVWWADTATLTFVTNGGTISSSTQTVNIGINGMTTAFDDVLKPTLSGTTFEGWCLDEDLTIPFTDPSQIHTNTTLYAKWGEVYTVRYEPGTYNGAAVNASWSDTKTAATNAYADYPKGYATIDSDITKDYYLKGWSLNGKTYLLGETIPITAEDCDENGVCTLTAVWGKKHTVKVEIDLSSISSASVTVNNKTYTATGTYYYYLKPGETINVSAKGKGGGGLFGHVKAKVSISGSDKDSSATTSALSQEKTVSSTVTGKDSGTTTITVKKN